MKTIKEAITSAGENMVLAARHYADKGATVYTAEIHILSLGLAMKKEFAAGLEPTATNYADLAKALYNHSAWRQKLVKLEVYPEPKARTSEASMADLEAEFGG